MPGFLVFQYNQNEKMRYCYFISFVIITVLCAAPTILSGQTFAAKGNIPYLATATPNAGLELGVSPKVTAELTYGLNPFSFGNDKQWKHWLAEVEVRYWLCERFYGHFLGLHAGASEYNISGIKLPISNFSRNSRYEGWAVLGGVSYGYSLVLGGRWNMEMTLGLGIVSTKYNRYECFHCGNFTGSENKVFLAPTKLGLSVVYMLK